MPVMRVKRIGSHEGRLPQYHSEGAAGLDLCAAIPVKRILQPGERDLIPTGFAIQLPDGCEGQVRPRSGLALNHGITVLNSPGTIDVDFRGEVCVLLINLGQEPFTIEPGMRIAQLIVNRYERVDLEVVEDLTETSRGAGGYGSTGT
jgi:dUTP pyrophosphatase